MNIFRAVAEFNKKYKVQWHKKPQELPEYLFTYRVKFLAEETNEFVSAWQLNDLEGQLDAMIDLIYVASGTLHLMGFDAKKQAEAFKRVHTANMKKVRATSASQSKRNHAFDVIKPKGWKASKLKDLCR